MEEFARHLPIVFISIILGYFTLSLLRAERRSRLVTHKRLLSDVKSQLLELYKISQKMYRIPELDQRFPALGEKSVDMAITVQVIRLVEVRRFLLRELSDLRYSIIKALVLFGDDGLLNANARLEEVDMNLSAAFDEFVKYIQTEYDPVRLEKMYFDLPKSYTDETHQLTKTLNDDFFGLQEKLTQLILGIELKLNGPKTPIEEGVA